MNHGNEIYKCKVAPWLAWKDYCINGKHLVLIYEQYADVYFILEEKLSGIWHNVVKNEIVSYNDAQLLSKLFLEKVLFFSEDCPDLQYISKVEKYNSLPQHISDLIKREGYIFDVHWDLTNKCNARCIHCYNLHSHDGMRNICSDELSCEDALKLVDDLNYLGVFRIVLSGGEAMTKEYFFDLCNYIRSKHIGLILYTNGLLLTEDNIAKLSELYLTAVCISVYGPNRMIHEEITRINNSYDKLVCSSRNLKKHRIKTCFKNTLLKPNVDYWEETYAVGKILSDNPMINVTIYPSMDDGNITPYALEPDDLYKLALQSDSPIDYQKKLHGVCNILKINTDTPCYNETNQLYIAPNGNVFPCIAAPYRIANVKQNNIRKLKRYTTENRFTGDIEKMTMEERLDNWRSLRISDLKECGKYDYCNFCIDVCPGDAYVMRGDYLLAPLNHCIIAKARYNAWLNNN